jgi:integrase
MVPSDMLTPTYTVFSRHSADCEHKSKPDYLDCNCKKWIRVYDPRMQPAKRRQTHFINANGQEQRSPFSAKTRNAAEAERLRQAYKDSHDPDKIENQKLRDALKKRDEAEAQKTATIEKAISAFLIWKADNPSRRSSKLSGKTSDSAMTAYRTLLGYVDQKGDVDPKRKGHLFTWLENVNPRPKFVSDLTPVLVDAFQSTWKETMNDLTVSKTFDRLNAFFDYCLTRGKWIESNPMEGLDKPSVSDDERNTAFSIEQYQSILDKLAERPQTVDNTRLQTLVELMRWSGMAIVDAVQFKRSTLVGKNLRYKRQKTGVLAKPTLASRVVELLGNVVPINGDANQPFRNVSRYIKSDIDYWRAQINELYAEAGLKTVTTDEGEVVTTGPHTLRHTFATDQLKTQYELGQVNLSTIADAMGDSVATFEKSYKHQIDALKRAHERAQNAIVEAQEAKLGRAK